MIRKHSSAPQSAPVPRRRNLNRLLFSTLALFSLMAVFAGGRLFARMTSTAGAPPQRQGGQGGQSDTAAEGLSRSATQQIQSLIEAKKVRTPAQRKIDSQLLFAMKMRRGEPIAAAAPTLEVGAQVDNDGEVVVDITAEIGGNLIEDLAERGVKILDVVPGYHSLRAQAPLDQLESVAALPQVRFIQPRQEGGTARSFEPAERPRGAPDFSARAARLRAFLSKAPLRLLTTSRAGVPSFAPLPPSVAPAPPAPTGPARAAAAPTTQGDVTHKAVTARSTFGINGTGLKVGVLSDGVTNLRESQALGALGEVKVLPGQAGAGDEGTAMLEIVHTLAPGAQLYFATANTGIARFAQNIRDLRAAGCDIIVDDFIYFAESPFQDGQTPGVMSVSNGGALAQAVNDVTASGALYFSDAENAGNLTHGTAGVWEGDFKNGGAATRPLPTDAGQVHDFGGGRLFNTMTVSSPRSVTLKWSDPLGGSTNDYDLYVLDPTGANVVAASVNDQNVILDPIEIVAAQPAGRRIVIAKFSGEGRFLQLNTNRGQLSAATSGVTYGHSTAAEAFSVAATPANFRQPPNSSGPFPNPFNASNKVELFSSDGPRHLFFKGDGSPFTPGNLLATGGVVRQKPDITAADGVSVTGVGNFSNPFFGTSAAAPHAAAIAALLKSANPGFSNQQIREALTRTAIDIEGPGPDRDSGAGIVMAFEAAQFLGVTPMADLDLGAVGATEASGDGDGFVEPGERGALTIQLKNLGVVNASGVTATLTSLTPGVVVTSPNVANYGQIAAGSGSATNATPFTFTLSGVAACNLTAIFSLSINYTGGPSPKTLSFELPTGAPPFAVTTTLDVTSPPAGPNVIAVTGLQAARLNRNSVASACGAAKAFPTVTGTGTRRYDAYTFAPTCPGGPPACITVTLSNACGAANRDLFPAVYLDSFDPNNLQTNYLADPGLSVLGGAEVFSFTIPSGKSFVVVVNEVNSGAGVGCDYTLTVSGLCQPCGAAKMVCLQDDRSRDFLLFNAFTGDYFFNSCSTGASFSGKGAIDRSGCSLTLSDGTRVRATLDSCTIGPANRGQAQVRAFPLGAPLFIKDTGLSNNTCACP
jgi:hypothetical protein